MITPRTELRIVRWVGLPVVTLNGLGILLLDLPEVLAFIVPVSLAYMLAAVTGSLNYGIGARWLRARRQRRGP